MILRSPKRLGFFCRGMVLASLLVTGAACVSMDEDSALALLEKKPNEPIQLPEAEHMIDELDRIMTAFGTISIKTPDVWGQDRLAKFRSEYEAQMAGWLKQSFKSDINASLRHSESEATRLMVGANVIEPAPKSATGAATTTTTSETINFQTLDKSQAALDFGRDRAGRRRRENPGCPRAHGRARRAFQLPESPEPTAPDQCRRRLD